MNNTFRHSTITSEGQNNVCSKSGRTKSPKYLHTKGHLTCTKNGKQKVVTTEFWKDAKGFIFLN
jgi:hypothetical protein